MLHTKSQGFLQEVLSCFLTLYEECELVCEQQRLISACVSAQSDKQILFFCCLDTTHATPNYTSIVYIEIHMSCTQALYGLNLTQLALL